MKCDEQIDISRMRSARLVSCLIMTAILLACSDDVIPQDTRPPEILRFEIANGTGPLSGKVTIVINVQDDFEVEIISVYIDNTLFKNFRASVVEQEWNTTTEQDGEHKIRMVAKDTNGNMAERTIHVTVKNTLLEIGVDSKFMDSNETGWVLLSDKAGKLIDKKFFRNADLITITLPEGFNLQDKFTLTRVVVAQPNQTSPILRYSMLSLTDIASGVYYFTRPSNKPSDSSPVVGSASLTVLDSNPLKPFAPNAFGAEIVKTTFQIGTIIPLKFIMDMSQQISECTFIIKEEDNANPLYFYRPEIEVGREYSQGVSSFRRMNKKIVNFDGTVNGRYDIWVISNNGKKSFIDTGGSFASNHIEIFYPDQDNYGGLVTDVYYTVENVKFLTENTGRAESIDFVKLSSDVELARVKNNYKISTTGSYDYKLMLATEFQPASQGSTARVFDWRVYMRDETTTEFRVPDLTDFSQQHPLLANHVFNFNRVVLVEYDVINGYQEYIEKVHQSKIPIQTTSKLFATKDKLFAEITNGRKNTPLEFSEISH